MRAVKHLVAILLLVISFAPGALAQPQTPPPPQTEYVPLANAPRVEQVPAARLVVAAYSVVLVALFGYVLSLSKRLGTVKGEIDRLERELKRSPRT
jgi:CcmD family protein